MTSVTSIKKSAVRVAKAREALHEEIRTARKEGVPLREIAFAAGISHETVRRICA